LHLDQLARRPPRLHPLALGGLDRGEQGPLRLSHCLRLALLGAELLTQQLFLDDDRLLHRAFRATAGLGGQLARQLLGKSCLDLHLQLQPPRLRLALPLGSDGGGEPPGERLVARERVPQALGFIVVDGQLLLQLLQHQLQLSFCLGGSLALTPQRCLCFVELCVHLRAA